jgi:DNA helicase-2/ATP-dependent DNA helicase PcrA
MNFSNYQIAIFDFIKSPDCKHAVVEAVAGSGKTTTIVEALKFLSPMDQALFVAFNKHIAEELRRRVPRNVEASTLNALGWKICRGNCKTELDAIKTENILRTLFTTSDEEERKTFYKLKGSINKIVGLLRALNIHDHEHAKRDILSIADKYDIGIPENLGPGIDWIAVAINVFQISINHTAHMDFDDQIYQPIHQDWGFPSYDWVFGDEGQDWSPVQIELIKRVGRNGRIIVVGDRHQSIYGFRGADPDAIPNIIKALDATVLPLSICYRCPDKVIAEAQRIVKHIESPPNNPKGLGVVEKITTEQFKKQMDDGDFVLCRTTAPLVKRCLERIRSGKKAIVKGRDIGQGLYDLLESLAHDTCEATKFLEILRQYKSEQLAKLGAAGRENEALAVEDRCDTLEVLALDARIVRDIKHRIDSIFSDGDSEGVTFCTGHKAKGLEAYNIFFLRPDLCPHPKAKKDWQKEQEENLQYVMTTRSMRELYYVTPEQGER